MTMTSRERFMRQSDAVAARLARENPGPDTVETKPCIRCGRRLEVTRRGSLVMRSRHQDTGLVPCTAPKDERCPICQAPAFLQCTEPGCDVLAHPKCLFPCACCDALKCPDHIGSDGMCDRCRLTKEATL